MKFDMKLFYKIVLLFWGKDYFLFLFTTLAEYIRNSSRLSPSEKNTWGKARGVPDGPNNQHFNAYQYIHIRACVFTWGKARGVPDGENGRVVTIDRLPFCLS